MYLRKKKGKQGIAGKKSEKSKNHLCPFIYSCINMYNKMKRFETCNKNIRNSPSRAVTLNTILAQDLSVFESI